VSVQAFAEQALLDFRDPTVDIPGATSERMHAMRSTASLFRFMRMPLVTGRAFAPDEDEPGGANVVVLSAGVAQQLFGAGSAIGRSVRIDGVPHEVVGITPAAALGVLAVATIAASLVPARRAAHIDPVVALFE
jgi:putative ABC transport system permease protein